MSKLKKTGAFSRFFSFSPSLIEYSPSYTVLAMPLAKRFLFVIIALVIILLLYGNSEAKPFVIMCAIVIGISALNDDRWIFNFDKKEIRKYYGLLIIPKSWAIDLDLVASVGFDGDFTGANPSDPFFKTDVPTNKPRCAIVLNLADSRTLTIMAAKIKDKELLHNYACKIAETINKPFHEE